MTATEQDYVRVIKDQSDTIERFARAIDDLYDVINLKEQSILILEETISIMKNRVDTKDAIIRVKEDMIQMLDEHINNIWKTEQEYVDPLTSKVDSLYTELEELETELVKVNAENDKWMTLCDKYLKKISDLEEWLTHYDGEIEYYQRKVQELSELNESYKETIKDLNDRLTDKYHHTVSDIRQVNESLDRDPQKIGGLEQILEQLRNERLGINPVV
jgi:chromosome segregation ATPase